MKHHLTETQKHNAEINNIILTNYLFNTGD